MNIRREQMLSPTPRNLKTSHRRGLRYQVWQKGFYDFNIYTESKFREKLDYMHSNPVKAGIVKHPADYHWSSYGQYFDEGNVAR
ncbi:MAG: hypothetical protein R6U37_00535 [Dehalococcoidia bacterium]